MRIALALLSFVLLPSGMAAQAAEKPKDAAPPVYKLSDAQRYRMDAARQRYYRFKDKADEALNDFGQGCLAAQLENKWPDVICNVDSLGVIEAPKPPAPAKPAEDPAKRVGGKPAAAKEIPPDKKP